MLIKYDKIKKIRSKIFTGSLIEDIKFAILSLFGLLFRLAASERSGLDVERRISLDSSRFINLQLFEYENIVKIYKRNALADDLQIDDIKRDYLGKNSF